MAESTALPTAIQVEIVTPETSVVSKSCKEVVLPGQQGAFGVRPGHAPMLCGLQPGVAMCSDDQGFEYFAISAGFVEVLPDRVTVLAHTCEPASAIDIERARTKVSEYETLIGQTSAEADPGQTRHKLQKHQARIHAANAGR